VIVPDFNEKVTIDELLRSVMVATIPSYDIGAQESDRGTAWKQGVVVDDGSTDGTAEKLKAWSHRFSWLVMARIAAQERQFVPVFDWRSVRKRD
jgi:glycosyltransferase involved in cell wall biosynthesis